MATWKSQSKKKRKASPSPKQGAPSLADLDAAPNAEEAAMMLEALAFKPATSEALFP